MEKIVRTLAIATLWYAIFAFVTNQLNPMMWDIIAKILAVVIGFSIVEHNLKD